MFLVSVIVTYVFYTSSKAESLEEMNPFLYSNAGNTVNFNDIFTASNSIAGGDNVIPDIKDDLFSLKMASVLVDSKTLTTTELYITTPPPREFEASLKLLRPNPIAQVIPYNKLTKTFDSATKEYDGIDDYIQRTYGHVQTAPAKIALDQTAPVQTSTIRVREHYPPRINVATTAAPIPIKYNPISTASIAAMYTTSNTLSTTTMTRAPSRRTKKQRRDRGVLDLLFPPKRVQSFKNVFDTIKTLLSYTFRR